MIASLIGIAAVCVGLGARDVQEVGKLLRDVGTTPPKGQARLLRDSPRCRRVAEAAGYGGRRVSVVQVGDLYAVLFGDELQVVDRQLRRVSLQPRRTK